MSNDSDNIATIAALMAENDRLRDELLKAPNAQMVALIAEFELWMEDDIKSTNECESTYPGSYGGGMLVQARGTKGKWHNLKDKHLPDSETE